ncbi:hypothetical protein B5E92_11590 [Erysipelatoclostridium sp. An15]|uniref:VirB4 family type IV secretion system protein n=1 Tax=Erysipelatoclostridium sp. An15 TaxID=1965566 RepID=UPI000B39002E|nr:hypothetical protein [Erysipelatoclostridium sp. An15]OUQ06074.1 hypothetical protein B5E92_11590 [Erysipelatoclostridium sp. An15]
MNLKSLFFKSENKTNKKNSNNNKKIRHIKDAIPVNWDESKKCFIDKNKNYIRMLKTTGTNLFGLKEEDQLIYMNAFSYIFNSNIGEGQIYSYEIPADVDQYIEDYENLKNNLDIQNSQTDRIKYDILANSQKYLEDTAVTHSLVDRCFIIILKDKDYFQLEKRLNEIINILGTYQKTRYLSSQEMLEIVYDYYNPADSEFISTTWNDKYGIIDLLYPDYIGFKEQGFKQYIELNGLCTKTKWLSTFYKEPVQALLCYLATYPNVEFSLHWTPAPQDSIKKDLDKSVQNLNKQIEKEKKASTALEKQKELKENLDLINSLVTDGSFAIYFSVSIRIVAENEKQLLYIENEIDKYVKRYNIKFRDGIHQPLEMFNLSAPLCQNEVENYMLETTADTMGYMYPFVFEALYDHTSEYRNNSVINYPPVYIGNTINTGGVVFYDDFVRQDDRSSSNEFIVGTTGMGKTFLLMWLIKQRYALGYKQYIIDVEGKELNRLTKALGGENINGANGFNGRINILQVRINIPDDDDIDEKISLDNIYPLSEHMRFLRNLLTIQKGNDNQDIRLLHMNKIEKALENLYKNIGITYSTTAKYIIDNYTNEDYPIMTDLLKELNKMLDKAYNAQAKDEADITRIKECIAFIEPMANGAEAHIFNGTTNINLESSLININLSGLNDNTDSKLLKAQYYNYLSYIWSSILSSDNTTRQKIYADEFSVIMDPRYTDIMSYFETIIKRIRKRNGGLCTATQQVSDVLKNSVRDYGEAIISQSTYQFYFGLGSSGAEYFKDSKLIPKQELEFIQFAGIGNCYFKVGSQTAMRINISIPPEELEFLEEIKGKN